VFGIFVSNYFNQLSLILQAVNSKEPTAL